MEENPTTEIIGADGAPDGVIEETAAEEDVTLEVGALNAG